MRKIEYTTIAIIVFLAIVLASGCLGKKSSAEYFPATPGMEWSYKINFESADPEIYSTIVFNPIVGGLVSNELAERSTKETLIADYYKSTQDCCHLRFKIVRTGSNKRNGQTVRIAELLMIRDDLGLFGSRNVLNHSWAMMEGPEGFKAVKMSIIPAMDFNLITPNMLVQSAQLVFFISSDNVNARSIVEGDVLAFIEYDSKPSECQNSSCMHFQRVVSDADLVEDAWYSKKIGLVRLEQKVNGEPSMTWILEDFKTD